MVSSRVFVGHRLKGGAVYDGKCQHEWVRGEIRSQVKGGSKKVVSKENSTGNSLVRRMGWRLFRCFKA